MWRVSKAYMPQSNRPLDFIVFGVPRSGTTAAARYINCVGRVHCGIEGFGYRRDHRRIEGPKAFIDNPFHPFNERSQRFSREDIARKGDKIRVFGNKLPKYFYRLNGVLSEIGTPRAILCYRNAVKAAASYHSRAKRETDRWPEGHVGWFAAADTLLMLHALAGLDAKAEVMVLPHQALLHDSQSAIRKALAFVAPGIAPEFDPKALDAVQELKSKTTNQPRFDLTDWDRKVLSRIKPDRIDAVLDRPEPFMLSEVRDRLPALLADLPRIRSVSSAGPSRSTRILPRSSTSRHRGDAGRRLGRTFDRPPPNPRTPRSIMPSSPLNTPAPQIWDADFKTPPRRRRHLLASIQGPNQWPYL